MLKEICTEYKNAGVLLGNFDGVHLGHRFLLEQFKQDCEDKGLEPIIVTFVPHPRVVLSNVKDFLLKSYTERRDILKSLGFKNIVEINFNRDFSSLSPDDFLETYIFCDKLKYICVGHDFKFGANKSGSYTAIQQFGKRHGIESRRVEPYEINSKAPSSSLIRQLLKSGDILSANELLGSTFSLEGIVVKGMQRGTKIGFPTANIDFPSELIVPKNGVYITETTIESMHYQSVTNIGYNPTFNSGLVQHVETHILDFDREIYGETIKVSFIKRLRDEIKFSSVNELIEQIHEDTANAREYFK